jgi:hypothetical protein
MMPVVMMLVVMMPVVVLGTWLILTNAASFLLCLHEQGILALATTMPEGSKSDDDKAHDQVKHHCCQNKGPMRKVSCTTEIMRIHWS